MRENPPFTLRHFRSHFQLNSRKLSGGIQRHALSRCQLIAFTFARLYPCATIGKNISMLLLDIDIKILRLSWRSSTEYEGDMFDSGSDSYLKKEYFHFAAL